MPVDGSVIPNIGGWGAGIEFVMAECGGPHPNAARIHRAQTYFPRVTKHSPIGSYAALRGSTIQRLPSSVECPSCHGPLHEYRSARIGRVVRECSSDDRPCDGLIAIVPTTHAVLGCEACGIHFTSERV